MAAKIFKEKKASANIETQPAAAATVMDGEAVAMKCYCCGLTEECTAAYIAGVREKYRSWICGLCAEAVEEEKLRSERDMNTDEAVKMHMKFCQQFRASNPPSNATEDLIEAMKNLLLRSLESPRRKGMMTCRPHLLFHHGRDAQKETDHQEGGRSRSGVSVE